MYHRSCTIALLVAIAPACATDDDVTADPTEAGDGKPDGSTYVDVRCTGEPETAGIESWQHLSSALIALATPNHRGVDLVASAGEPAQVISGDIAYGILGKRMIDEIVDVFACRAGKWSLIGSTTTDDDGMFSIELEKTRRLPLGLRDMFVSVRGDRSGAPFLALVAPQETAFAVSDVDGTLTTYEDEFQNSLISGATVEIQPGAAEALKRLHARGKAIAYVTARGRRFTEDTRAWLAANGMPRGPLRLAPSLITLPGSDTVAYKSDTFEALESHAIEIEIGIGNRASDIAAYASVGVSSKSIHIKLPEFEGEVAEEISAQHAVGFTAYSELVR